MPIPMTGPINFRNATYGIASEFGGAQPDGISEYYRGGTLVPASVTNAIATAGTQKWSNYRGASFAVAPVWTPIPDQTTPSGTALVLDVAPYISDPSATISMDGLPVTGITFSGTRVTVNLQNSTKSDIEALVTLRAVNSVGSATTTVKFTVQPGPFTPYFSSVPREWMQNETDPRVLTHAGTLEFETGTRRGTEIIDIMYYDESHPNQNILKSGAYTYFHAATQPAPGDLVLVSGGSMAGALMESFTFRPPDATFPAMWRWRASPRVSGYIGHMTITATTPQGSATLYVGWRTVPNGSTSTGGTVTTTQPSNGTHNLSGNMRWNASSSNVDFVWGAPSVDGNARPTSGGTDATGWGIASIGGIQNVATGQVVWVVNLVNDLDGQKAFNLTLRFGSQTVTLRSSSGSSVITGTPPYRQVQIRGGPMPPLPPFDGQIIPFTAVMT